MEEILSSLLENYGFIGIILAYFLYEDHKDREQTRMALREMQEALSIDRERIAAGETKIKNLEREVFRK